MNQLIKNFYSNRMKLIVILQFILLIPVLIYLVYSFSSENINPFYRGLFYLLLAATNLLNYVEDKILKKKEMNDFNLWLMTAIVFFVIGIVELFTI